MNQQTKVDPLQWLTEQAVRAQNGEQSRVMVIQMANAVGAELQALRDRVAELEAPPKETLEG